jgi:predicted HNH restriction endonuclease
MGRRKGSKSYSKEELKEFIDKFISINNRVPERRDFENNPDYPSWRQYVTNWGSWGQAIVDLGYRDSKKEKKQLKNYKCLECGGEFESYHKRKYCSIKCRDEYNRKQPKAKARLTKENYRATAFRAYEWKCEICGMEEDVEYLYGKSKSVEFPTILDVHHIDSDRNNNNYRNLSVLCPTCHAKVHRGIIVNLRRDKPFLKLKWDKLSLEEFNNK